MDIPAKYLEVIAPLIAKARSFVEAAESLAPIAFVGNFATRQILHMDVGTADDDTKDRSALAIQVAAAQLDADFIFTVMEAWGLPKDKVGRHEEIREQYGSIANCPYKVDVVSFILQTRYGIWAAQVSLKPKGHSKKKRTFDEVAFKRMDSAEGRFVGLLPAREDALMAGTPLQ